MVSPESHEMSAVCVNSLDLQISRAFAYISSKINEDIIRCSLGKDAHMETLLGTAPKEIGSTLLILRNALRFFPDEVITQKLITRCKMHMCGTRFNFFIDKSILPFDADTTAWALDTLYALHAITLQEIQEEVSRMVENTDTEGVIQIYYEPEKQQHSQRIDEVALANILNIIYLCNMEEYARPTEERVLGFLESGEYLIGSRYYPSPDTFLYFLSRLLKYPRTHKLLNKVLTGATLDRIGKTGSPLDAAMRITTCLELGLDNEQDLQTLISGQESNGSWKAEALYRYGTKEIYFGSKEITTAFALEALLVRLHQFKSLEPYTTF